MIRRLQKQDKKSNIEYEVVNDDLRNYHNYTVNEIRFEKQFYYTNFFNKKTYYKIDIYSDISDEEIRKSIHSLTPSTIREFERTNILGINA